MMTRLTKLSEEELARRAKLRERVKTSDDVPVTSEMYFLAEFGYYFGWQGVLSIENDEITMERARDLLAAVRKVWYLKLYEQSLGNFYAFRDGPVFIKGIATFVTRMQVES